MTVCLEGLRALARAVCFGLMISWVAGISPASAAQPIKPWGGGAAPALVLRDVGGTTHDLAQLRGKVVLVNFWATWCEPCRQEMPAIQRLREKLAGKPFAVLMVNVDEPDARVRRYLAETRLDLTVLMDPGKQVTRGWNVRVLPTTFIIDPEGRTRYRHIGDIDWSHESLVGLVEQLLNGG